jgi:hypothetical protein
MKKQDVKNGEKERRKNFGTQVAHTHTKRWGFA